MKTVRNGYQAPDDSTKSAVTGQPVETDATSLKRFEGVFVTGVFLVWILLFAGGILIDSGPYRDVVGGKPSTLQPQPGQVSAWIHVLLFYLPINLAFLCALSSILGAFGNRVNLYVDGTPGVETDQTSPYLSALMRGFFIYLFLISGLLLLDEQPFTSPTQNQYIRLAGFISLFGFVVSYHPRIFNALILVASQRIRKTGEEQMTAESKTRVEVTRAETVAVARVEKTSAAAETVKATEAQVGDVNLRAPSAGRGAIRRKAARRQKS